MFYWSTIPFRPLYILLHYPLMPSFPFLSLPFLFIHSFIIHPFIACLLKVTKWTVEASGMMTCHWREQGDGKWKVAIVLFVRKAKAIAKASCQHLLKFHWPWLVSWLPLIEWKLGKGISCSSAVKGYGRMMKERVQSQPCFGTALVEMLLSFSTQGLTVSIMSLPSLRISGCREVKCISLL